MDKTIGPAARTMRFLAFTLVLAGTILWAVRHADPRPWIILRFLGLDMRAMFTHREFYFDGRWLIPGWRFLSPLYQYIAGSWKASLMVGAALFVGGVAALQIDRWIIRWNRSPTRPMP
jgi:hypothetical protein